MKKTLITLLITMLTTAAWAIPAKPNQWKTLRLADGTEVRARLCGDEHAHFWMTDDGSRYVEDGEHYAPVSREELQARAMNRRTTNTASARMLAPRRVEIGERTQYLGQKKGLVVLAEFTNVAFNAKNDSARYVRIFNEPGYNEGSFVGAVTDYFSDQSAGRFELTFDVIGPVKLKNNQRYYGANDSYGNDVRPEEMIIEACKAADEWVDFKDYDWDGDGVADQVFVVYAGQGEADGGAAATIWPHMWSLAAAGKSLTLDGIKIDNYACSNELDGSRQIEGIGVFCHEFSHCLGFPDFYDINYNGQFGMGDFDLMCGGSYNGGGFIPAGYTAHEKMMCGWQEPIVLGDEDVTVTELLPMSSNGDTYIIYNDAHPDEYYMLENRQKAGWDAGYPARGLMITHVDFDRQVWLDNIPNTIMTDREARQNGLTAGNDHQRMTIVHADNDDDSKYWNSYFSGYTKYTTSTDLYPYQKNDSLTDTSKPAATLFNKDSRGLYTLLGAVLDIKQNANGTMSFTYRAKPAVSEPGDDPEKPDTPDDPDDPDEPEKPYIFYESFDECSGKGGNDGKWNGSVASSGFLPDNEGWTALSDKAYGGSACAKFGTGSVVGIVSTPAFTIDGKATLTFKAAAWDSPRDGEALGLEAEDADVEPSEFTMKKGEWTDFTATITGKGSIRLTFQPALRFFLDEVLVVKAAEEDEPEDDTSAIKTVQTTTRATLIYTLGGQLVGTSLGTLQPGIYVINGKKIIK